MKLASLSFSDNESIPERYAFARIDPHSHVALADNFNPQFSWDDVPDGTQSFAMVCHDPDVPASRTTSTRKAVSCPPICRAWNFSIGCWSTCRPTCGEIEEGVLFQRHHAARQGRPTGPA